jgi:hypothetical protein
MVRSARPIGQPEPITQKTTCRNTGLDTSRKWTSQAVRFWKTGHKNGRPLSADQDRVMDQKNPKYFQG